MFSHTNEESDVDSLLVPIQKDSLLYPKNISKVKNLLEKMKHNGDNDVERDGHQRNFYRHLFKPHFEELSDPVDVSLDRKSIKLVNRDDTSNGSAKVRKLSQAIVQSNIKIDAKQYKNHDELDVLDISSKCKINSSRESDEFSHMTNIVESAQTDQLLQQNWEQWFEKFCLIPNENDKKSLCRNIARCMNKDTLTNLISFLTGVSCWDSYENMKIFVQLVIFDYLLLQDLENEYQEVLPLLMGLLVKDEQLLTNQFVLPLISRSEVLQTETLMFLTQVANQLQKLDNKKAVIRTYLSNGKQTLSDESEITFLEEVLSADDLNFFEDDILLNDFCAYLLDSTHHNKNSSTNFNKNIKLGKFLLTIVKRVPTEIPSTAYVKLSQTVDLHSSFLKKSISAEFKKKQARNI